MQMHMRGIVRELQRKASAACHGRDLRANVRARLYWLRRGAAWPTPMLRAV